LIVFSDQGLALPSVALLTILSTEFVQKGKICPRLGRDSSMRDFYAWQESPYGSSTLPLMHGLANNLINRICEEVHSWGKAGKVPMRIFCA
jgi:hypothetical protein